MGIKMNPPATQSSLLSMSLDNCKKEYDIQEGQSDDVFDNEIDSNKAK